MAQVLRRLQRLCEHYGSDPTFCFSSATIGNPAELASTLAGRPVTAITTDGAPRCRRGFACWQRPLVDPHAGTRSSANAETADIVAHFVARRSPDTGLHPESQGFRARRRAGTRPARGVVPRLRHTGPSDRRLPRRLPRGGAPRARAGARGPDPRRRRGDERARARHRRRRPRRGRRQRVPRNGRVPSPADGPRGSGDARAPRRSSSAATTSSTSGTRRTRAELLERPAEPVIANPDNPFVMSAHVGCAAHELPLEPGDERWFGPGLDDAVRDLVLADRLKPRDGRMHWAGRELPRARWVSAAGRAWRSSSSTRRATSSAPSTALGCSTSRTRARCTCTKAGSTGSSSSMWTRHRRCSLPRTTPTSTPRRARRPSCRSCGRRSRRSPGRVAPTSAPSR